MSWFEFVTSSHPYGSSARGDTWTYAYLSYLHASGMLAESGVCYQHRPACNRKEWTWESSVITMRHKTNKRLRDRKRIRNPVSRLDERQLMHANSTKTRSLAFLLPTGRCQDLWSWLCLWFKTFEETSRLLGTKHLPPGWHWEMSLAYFLLRGSSHVVDLSSLLQMPNAKYHV